MGLTGAIRGVVILLATLLGVRMFVLLIAILGGFAGIGCVAYIAYHQSANTMVVILASAIPIVLAFSFLLLRKAHDGKEGIHQKTNGDSGHRVHLRGQG